MAGPALHASPPPLHPSPVACALHCTAWRRARQHALRAWRAEQRAVLAYDVGDGIPPSGCAMLPILVPVWPLCLPTPPLQPPPHHLATSLQRHTHVSNTCHACSMPAYHPSCQVYAIATFPSCLPGSPPLSPTHLPTLCLPMPGLSTERPRYDDCARAAWLLRTTPSATCRDAHRFTYHLLGFVYHTARTATPRRYRRRC